VRAALAAGGQEDAMNQEGKQLDGEAERPSGDAGSAPGRTGPGQGGHLWDRRQTPGFWVLLAFLCALLVTGVLIFLPFCGALFLAVVFTTLLYPYYLKVLHLVGEKKRGVASALMCLLFVLLIMVPISWIGLAVVREAPSAVQSVASQIKTGIENLCAQEEVKQYLGRHPVMEEQKTKLIRELAKLAGQALPPLAQPGPIDEKQAPAAGAAGEERSLEQGIQLSKEGLVTLVQNLTRIVAAVLAGVLGLLIKIVLMLFLMFYFFKDGPQILDSFRRGIPVDQETQERVVRTFMDVNRSMIRGTFLTALSQGSVAGVAYFFLGRSPFFWGAMTTLCAMIPLLGTALVTVPMTITFVLSGQWTHAVIMAVVAFIISTMDNIIRPLLVRGQLHLHPIWILLSVLGGVSVFGPPGIVVGPMVVVLIRTCLALMLEGSTAEAESSGEQG
jgi:predicted PurR-regulated permease PerM